MRGGPALFHFLLHDDRFADPRFCAGRPRPCQPPVSSPGSTASEDKHLSSLCRPGQFHDRRRAVVRKRDRVAGRRLSGPLAVSAAAAKPRDCRTDARGPRGQAAADGAHPDHWYDPLFHGIEVEDRGQWRRFPIEIVRGTYGRREDVLDIAPPLTEWPQRWGASLTGWSRIATPCRSPCPARSKVRSGAIIRHFRRGGRFRATASTRHPLCCGCWIGSRSG